MNQITLNTTLNHLELTDKLRTRLKLMKCRTFQDIMEADPSSWENVTPKVINALKRFQQKYTDAYATLKNNPEAVIPGAETRPVPYSFSKERSAQSTAADERRFFVANNILNAMVASGKFDDGDLSLTRQNMQRVMELADIFMDSYDKEPDYAAAVPNAEEKEKEEETPVEKPDETVTEEAGEILNKIQITGYKGKRAPNRSRFQVGDVVTVTELRTDGKGVTHGKGICGEKTSTFDSSRYEWQEITSD